MADDEGAGRLRALLDGRVRPDPATGGTGAKQWVRIGAVGGAHRQRRPHRGARTAARPGGRGDPLGRGGAGGRLRPGDHVVADVRAALASAGGPIVRGPAPAWRRPGALRAAGDPGTVPRRGRRPRRAATRRGTHWRPSVPARRRDAGAWAPLGSRAALLGRADGRAAVPVTGWANPARKPVTPSRGRRAAAADGGADRRGGGRRARLGVRGPRRGGWESLGRRSHGLRSPSPSRAGVDRLIVPRRHGRAATVVLHPGHVATLLGTGAGGLGDCLVVAASTPTTRSAG